MKKYIIVVTFVFLASGCGEDPVTLEEEIQRAIRVVEGNESILDDVMIDGRIITAQGVYEIQAKNYATRDEFIGAMLLSIADVYTDAANSLPKPYGISAPPFAANKIRQHLSLFPSGYIGPSGTGLLELMRADVESAIQKMDNEFTVIQEFSWNRTTGSSRSGGGGAGKVTVSDLHFSNVHVQIHDLILTAQTSEGNADVNLDPLNSLATIQQKLFLGLLVPAIHSGRTPSSKYINLINSIVDLTPNERATFDHDVREVTYLATLLYMLSDDYKNQDEYEASLEINRQVFDALMVMVLAKAYDVYK